MKPPSTTLAIKRCTFTGHHVGFQVATQGLAHMLPPSAITTGLAWKVAQEFGTIMMKNAKTSSRKPRNKWRLFLAPCMESHPYQERYSVTGSSSKSTQYPRNDGKNTS